MTDWTSGYVSEIDYPHVYYREMSPIFLEMALLSQLQQHRRSQPLRYLELGIGQGLSLNIHAAATDGEFWGNDFNPAMAANARALAAASGAKVHITDESFAELAARDDLPEFDVIALHGVWSWISGENRRVIIDLAQRKLAAGGIFYISYNCTPGWAATMPLRHLMTQHSKLATGEIQGMENRVGGAVDFAGSLADAGALYFKANPEAANGLQGLKTANRRYLAHEYFNADWHPMAFSEVAELLFEAKLGFGASAALLDHLDEIHFPLPLRKIIQDIPHAVFRETVRDYGVNRQFRRDIFVKGPQPVSPAQQMGKFMEMRFTLLCVPSATALKVTGTLGEVQLQPELYGPLTEILAADCYRPKSFREISMDAALAKMSRASLIHAVILLTGAGYMHPVQEEEAIARALPKSRALNAHLVAAAEYSGDIAFLSSPVLGAGIAADRFQQLCLRAMERGLATPSAWAEDIWGIISAQRQRVLKEGKPIDSPEESLAELTRQGEKFQEARLPILQTLRVV